VSSQASNGSPARNEKAHGGAREAWRQKRGRARLRRGDRIAQQIESRDDDDEQGLVWVEEHLDHERRVTVFDGGEWRRRVQVDAVFIEQGGDVAHGVGRVAEGGGAKPSVEFLDFAVERLVVLFVGEPTEVLTNIADDEP
jgi:hypothetical protein